MSDQVPASDRALGVERISSRTFHPHAAQGELADKYNGMPKYVVSGTLTDPGWNNTRVLSGGLVEEVTRLKDGEVARALLTTFGPALLEVENFLVPRWHPWAMGDPPGLTVAPYAARRRLARRLSVHSGQ